MSFWIFVVSVSFATPAHCGVALAIARPSSTAILVTIIVGCHCYAVLLFVFLGLQRRQMYEMAMTLTADDAKDWIYKGEGGANLVLGYCGSSPFLVGKVLRVHKVLRDEAHSVIECKRLFSECELLVWGDIPQLVKSTSKEFAEQVFAVQVMGLLLDSKHIDGGVPIFVTKEFLESVEKNVRTQRPPWRLHATEVDLLSHSALLMSDHSVFSSGSLEDNVCLAVEIKPKCGFLPSSKFIAEQNAVKKSVTRFRMHQLLKFHQGEETCLLLCSLSRQCQLLEELLETNQPSSSQLKMCGMLIGVFAIFGLITFLSLQMFDHQSRQIFVGYINVASLVSMFASPLFIINLVIKTKSVEFMPFHLSFATFLMSISFFAYGMLLRDFFIYIPNGIGSVLGIIQLLLYGHYREKSREDYTLPLFVS